MNDGGPAYPATFEMWSQGVGGASLRDYFAAAALQAEIPSSDSFRFIDTARTAYKYADAMLAAREDTTNAEA